MVICQPPAPAHRCARRSAVHQTAGQQRTDQSSANQIERRCLPATSGRRVPFDAASALLRLPAHQLGALALRAQPVGVGLVAHGEHKAVGERRHAAGGPMKAAVMLAPARRWGLGTGPGPHRCRRRRVSTRKLVRPWRRPRRRPWRRPRQRPGGVPGGAKAAAWRRPRRQPWRRPRRRPWRRPRRRPWRRPWRRTRRRPRRRPGGGQGGGQFLVGGCAIGVALCNVERCDAAHVGHQVLHLARAPDGEEALFPVVAGMAPASAKCVVHPVAVSTVMMLRGSSSALSLPSARSKFAPAIGAWTMVADGVEGGIHRGSPFSVRLATRRRMVH